MTKISLSVSLVKNVKFKHFATHLSKVGDSVQYIDSNEEPSELCRSQLPYHYQDTLEEEDKQ